MVLKFECNSILKMNAMDFDDLWEDDLPEPPPPGPTENGGFEGPMGRFFAPPSLALEPEGPQFEYTLMRFFHRLYS